MRLGGGDTSGVAVLAAGLRVSVTIVCLDPRARNSSQRLCELRRKTSPAPKHMRPITHTDHAGSSKLSQMSLMDSPASQRNEHAPSKVPFARAEPSVATRIRRNMGTLLSPRPSILDTSTIGQSAHMCIFDNGRYSHELLSCTGSWREESPHQPALDDLHQHQIRSGCDDQEEIVGKWQRREAER